MFSFYCCCSIAKLCLTLCDPMDWSTPGIPVLQYLPQITQTNVYSAMSFNHLILCCSLLLLFSFFPHSFLASGSFPMSRLFASGGQSVGASASASVLPMNIQGWFSLGLTRLISLQSKGLSRVFSSTIVRKHRFLGIQLSLCFNSHIRTWLLENYSFNCMDLCWQSDFSAF